MKNTILLVDDSDVRRQLAERLLHGLEECHVEVATDAQEALDALAHSDPDLILASLALSRVDGLTLLRLFERKNAAIPVVVLGQHEDDAFAAEAFRSGAAGFVPRARQAVQLVDTVHRILRRVFAERQLDRVHHCLPGTLQCRTVIRNDSEQICALVGRVQEMMVSLDFACRRERIRLAEALEEALLSAMYRENIRIVMRVSSQKAQFTLCSEGRKLDAKANSEVEVNSALGFEDDRRLAFVRSIMDEVAIGNDGNELKMSKQVTRNVDRVMLRHLSPRDATMSERKNNLNHNGRVEAAFEA